MTATPVNPDRLSPAVGFSHGVLTAGGRLLHIAGETGHDGDMNLASGFVAQFGQACRNLVTVVEEAGGSAQDVVSMTIFTTDVPSYRADRVEVGRVYREVFGKHFPAMALVGVAELVDDGAVVEIVGVAVIPE